MHLHQLYARLKAHLRRSDSAIPDNVAEPDTDSNIDEKSPAEIEAELKIHKKTAKNEKHKEQPSQSQTIDKTKKSADLDQEPSLQSIDSQEKPAAKPGISSSAKAIDSSSERSATTSGTAIRKSPCDPLNYPAHLITHHRTQAGIHYTIRPIRPEDTGIEADLVNSLSDEAKYFRFRRGIGEVDESMLSRFTCIDYEKEMALIAVTKPDGHEIELGVARYVVLSEDQDDGSCEFAIVVADQFQHQGVGRLLMEKLIEVARSRKLHSMQGEILSENLAMLNLCEQLGFRIGRNPDDRNLRNAILFLNN